MAQLNAGGGAEGRVFPWPPGGKPYDVQQQLMEQIFRVISPDEGPRVGIFESPTGTGKTMALLTASLHWLLDVYPAQRAEKLTNQQQQQHAPSSAPSAGDALDWIQAFSAEKEAAEDKKVMDDWLHTRQNARLRISKVPEPRMSLGPAVNHRSQKVPRSASASVLPTPKDSGGGGGDADTQFLVDWAQTPSEQYEQLIRTAVAAAKDEPEAEPDRRLDEDLQRESSQPQHELPQIIVASRTHSQLQQLVQEISKTVFNERVCCVSLGSRKNLCINPDVVELGSVQLMNERCLDMMQGKATSGKASASSGSSTSAAAGSTKRRSRSAASAKCPYLAHSAQEWLSDRILAEVTSIEDLHAVGERTSACPYYASRRAVGRAHVVTLPYASLVHKATRESLGVRLKGSVVIVDEAHNIVEAVNQAHSSRLSLRAMQHSEAQLSRYLDRYKALLKSVNSNAIKQLVHLLHKLSALVKAPPTSQPQQQQHQAVACDEPPSLTTVMMINDLPTENMNLFHLLKFIDQSELVNKLRGFVQAGEPHSAGAPAVVLSPDALSAATAAFSQFRDFIEALCRPNRDGRVIVQRAPPSSPAASTPAGVTAAADEQQQPGIQIVMLNPAAHFEEIVREARAVVLLGGTMQPFGVYKDQLLGFLPADRFHTFACGHVVDGCRVLAASVTAGPGAASPPLVFSFARRGDPRLLDALGELLLRAVKCAPKGVVVFFQSYDYQDRVWARWTQTAVAQALNQVKRVFKEVRGANVDDTFAAYKRHVDQSAAGALISCVVGGKMSEGINFSDDYARLVVMVGLPYANKSDPVLREKMAYLDAHVRRGVGEEHYHNLCMRAVNQSIGRSIRHANDYAAILLVDERYRKPVIKSALPSWIMKSCAEPPTCEAAIAMLTQFYRDRQAHERQTAKLSSL